MHDANRRNYEISESLAEHVAATADASAKVREGMIVVRFLDGIVKTNTPTIPAN